MKYGEPTLPESLGIYTDTLEEYDLEITMGLDPEALPGYIDSGAVSYVYKLDDQTVGKIPRAWEEYVDPYEAAAEIDAIERTLGALHRATGMPHVEQLRYWSFKDLRAWCTDYIPGRTLSGCDIQQATEEQYSTLLDTIENVHSIGALVDEAVGNVMYHPLYGFTVLDYSIASPSWLSLTNDNDRLGLLMNIQNLAMPGVLFEARKEKSFDLGNIPETALLFRAICHERYGPELTDKIDATWQEHITYFAEDASV